MCGTGWWFSFSLRQDGVGEEPRRHEDHDGPGREQAVVDVEDHGMDPFVHEARPAEFLESVVLCVLLFFETPPCRLEFSCPEFDKELVAEVVRSVVLRGLRAVLPDVLGHLEEVEPILQDAEPCLSLEVPLHALGRQFALVSPASDDPDVLHGFYRALGQIHGAPPTVHDDGVGAHHNRLVEHRGVDVIVDVSAPHLSADLTALHVDGEVAGLHSLVHRHFSSCELPDEPDISQYQRTLLVSRAPFLIHTPACESALDTFFGFWYNVRAIIILSTIKLFPRLRPCGGYAVQVRPYSTVRYERAHKQTKKRGRKKSNSD